jgi:CRP/FNR family transcriptional regulator, cyclic AMP receptor protein
VEQHSKLWHLEQVHLLNELPEDQLKKVEAMTTMKTKEKGSYIYFPKEPSKVVFFLKSGRVKIGTYSKDGKEIIKAIINPGDMFGEMGLVGEETRTDFAIALEDDVRICSLGVAEALSLMKANPELSLKVTYQIGNRLRKAERKFESLIFKDARTRIVEFVRQMAEEMGENYSDEILINHSLTHQDIASLTATSRQTVTTILNQLKEAKIIQFDRKSILIHDLKRLK